MERQIDAHDDDLIDLGSVTAETKGADGGFFDDLGSKRYTPGILID